MTISFGNNQGAGSNIVFVHLNSKVPRYLILNIKSVIRRFPSHKIYLITNSKKFQINLKGLESFTYKHDNFWFEAEEFLSHPREFRSNFWLISLARFFAIAQFMKQIPGPVLHIESDVVISDDFPIAKFEGLTEYIAYPIVSQLRGIASTIYFSSPELAHKLALFCVNQARENGSTSDMLILRRFYDRFPEDVYLLPIGPSSQFAYHDTADIHFLNGIKKGLKYFNGIFDGSDIGVYYFGTDPRNRRGWSTLRSPIDFNYSRMETWKCNFNESRNFVEICHESSLIPVFSIHATCKKPGLFKYGKSTQILKTRTYQSLLPSKNEFIFDIFLRQAYESVRRRILIRDPKDFHA